MKTEADIRKELSNELRNQAMLLESGAEIDFIVYRLGKVRVKTLEEVLGLDVLESGRFTVKE